jgi:hypothetical protein
MDKINKLLLTLITIFLMACGANDNPDEDEQARLDLLNQEIFDIVYLAQGYREIGSATWRPVNGQKKMKFCVSNSPDCIADLGLSTSEAADITENATENFDGFFSFFHIRYQENQFNSPCSGGYIGYYIDSQNFIQPDIDDDDNGWNIFDPYENDSSGGSTEVIEEDEDSEIGLVRSFTLYTRILADQINLDESCAAPEFNSLFELVRYENGDVIASDRGRGVQYFFQPLLRNQLLEP